MKVGRTFWVSFGVGAGVSVAIVLGCLAMLHPDFWGSQPPLGGDFRYDPPTKYRQITPSMEAYREAAEFETGLAKPTGLAMGPEGIYVCGDRAVRVFTAGGKFVREISLAGEPRAIAVTPETIFLAMADHVESVGLADLKRTVGPALGSRTVLTSIAAAGDELYVADAGQRRVVRCDRSGNPRGEIGRADAARGIEGFVLPSPHFDVAMAPDGLLRAANGGRHRVEAYTPQGDLEFFWGVAALGVDGFSGCCNPAAMAIFADGRIVTGEKGELAMVKIFAADGQNGGDKLLCVVAGPARFGELTRQIEEAMDIAVDGERVLVLDPARRSVRIFEPKPAAASGPATQGAGHE